MERLDGKVVLVTGGAQGLGAAICRRLSQDGARIVCADILEERAQAFARELRHDDRDVTALGLDVRDESAVKRAVAWIADQFGRLDVAINNAGTDVTRPVEELTSEQWRRVVGTNLDGPFWVCQAAFPIMKAQGEGTLINVASTAAKRAWANASGYHASKWGLLGLSHALHVEGRPHNIKVTALVAGGMRTPFLLDRFAGIDVETLQEPENVAQTVRFLLTLPAGTVIPELMVLPMKETSWP